MATVQIFYFTKNNIVDFDCTAKSTDIVLCEGIVTFSASELGRNYMFQWLIDTVPYTSRINKYSDVIKVTELTTTFFLNDLSLSIGEYKLMYGFVYEV